MTKQGVAIGTADDMWKFLAKVILLYQPMESTAQADIAEDGYWGVEQTSDRILDFAKALSGDDPDKADAMLEAFKKGFEQATKSWERNFRIFPREPTQLSRNSTNGKTEQRMLPLRRIHKETCSVPMSSEHHDIVHRSFFYFQVLKPYYYSPKASQCLRA